MKHTPLMSQKGATAVEVALILMFLILLILGIIDFGLYLFNRQVITSAAREGTRYGVVAREDRRTNPQIENEVTNWIANHLVTFGPYTFNITILPIDYDTSDGFDPDAYRCVDFDYIFAGNRYRCELKVQVDFDYHWLFLSTIIKDPMPIQSIAVMKME